MYTQAVTTCCGLPLRQKSQETVYSTNFKNFKTAYIQDMALAYHSCIFKNEEIWDHNYQRKDLSMQYGSPAFIETGKLWVEHIGLITSNG